MHQEQVGFAIPVKQRAQDVVEYGIIVATIALVVLLGVMTFGSQIEPWFAQLAGHITTVGT
jgi:Flp pilus assembly pilin Flp